MYIIFYSVKSAETECFTLGLEFLQSNSNYVPSHLIQVLAALLLRDLGVIKHSQIETSSINKMLNQHVRSSTEWGSVSGSTWDKSMSIPPAQVLHIIIQIFEALNNIAVVDSRCIQDIPQDLKVIYFESYTQYFHY